MKKILLVTMQDQYNIGNRLQNYALTTVLEQYGNKVSNIDNGYTELPGKKAVLKHQIKRMLGSFGIKKYEANDKRYYVNPQLRREANTAFTRKNMSSMITTTCSEAFRQDWSMYDLAIVGSDQVWHNWKHWEKELPFFYLEFMPSEKRVSYAASFGFEEFPAEDREEHIRGLKSMYAISCRESSGCALIKRETGRDAVHVLDPTLLLSADDWRNAAAPIPKDLHVEKGGYIFMYFLGQITDEYQKFIDDVQAKRGVKMFDFMNLKDEAIARCGVGEFLSLIDNADYVLTDSFHCTVFSILFHKEFTVFKRKGEGFDKMFGRIEDLLKATGNTNRAFEPIAEDPDAVSFEVLKENSQKYLKDVLS